MNKAVIFDLDGTLVDTLPDITFYTNYALRKYGIREITEPEVRNLICHASRKLMQLCAGIEDENDPLVDLCHDYYNEAYSISGSPNTKVYDGIKDVLKELKARGYKIGIFTNKLEPPTLDIYRNHLSDIEFDKIVGLKEGVKHKPDPTEIIKMLDEFGVEKKNAYFVGDGDTDVLASKNAGVKCIAVTYGYRDKEILEALGASIFADTPKEILDIILKGEES